MAAICLLGFWITVVFPSSCQARFSARYVCTNCFFISGLLCGQCSTKRRPSYLIHFLFKQGGYSSRSLLRFTPFMLYVPFAFFCPCSILCESLKRFTDFSQAVGFVRGCGMSLRLWLVVWVDFLVKAWCYAESLLKFHSLFSSLLHERIEILFVNISILTPSGYVFHPLF